MKELQKKLKELQKKREEYCLMSNVVPEKDYKLPSEEFVKKWVSYGLEYYNRYLYVFRLQNESKIVLLEELIGDLNV